MPVFLTSILAALSAAIAPEINYVEQELESVGASLASGILSLLLGFTADQRKIFTSIIAFYQAQFAANQKAGMSITDSLTKAFTATLNEFCAEEGAEFNDEKTAFLTLVNAALTQAAAAK